MPSIVSHKYRTHSAKQFMESLSEGVRTYGANTATADEDSTTITISSNVFSTMRVGDILMINNESRLITAIASNGTEVTVNTAFSTAISTQLFTTREQLAAYDTYYLFIGRTTPWANDAAPDTPVDTVANTSYDYLNDVVALKRITADNLVYVVPRYNWENGVVYNMYDHRTRITGNSSVESLLGNTANPFYVRTSTNDVFKCLYNGRANANSAEFPQSIEEPTITGVPSVSDIIGSASNSQNQYEWKYLYTISDYDAERFLTTDYMPVRDASDTLDSGSGDVYNDNSNLYTAFDFARTTGNGAIYTIIVEDGGTGYENPPQVDIVGDGQGATATAELTGNVVTSIRMNSYGTDYSHATVTIDGDGSGATATAIISPRNAFANTSGIFYRTNHGISNKDELFAHKIMLYVELDGIEGGAITTENEYRRIGILKNPSLLSGEIASANVYDTRTVLTYTGDQFIKDEIVWQESTGAYGIVVEQTVTELKLSHVSGSFSASEDIDTTIVGVGNGNTEAVRALTQNAVPTAVPTEFSAITASGGQATISRVEESPILPLTGEILYVDQRVPITQNTLQVEVVRTILSF